jgi:hypothetical protein
LDCGGFVFVLLDQPDEYGYDVDVDVGDCGGSSPHSGGIEHCAVRMHIEPPLVVVHSPTTTKTKTKPCHRHRHRRLLAFRLVHQIANVPWKLQRRARH